MFLDKLKRSVALKDAFSSLIHEVFPECHSMSQQLHLS